MFRSNVTVARDRSAVTGAIYPGHLIIVEDPDDSTIAWRFIPKTGNNGVTGVAYCCSTNAPDAVEAVGARGGGDGSARVGSKRAAAPPASALPLADQANHHHHHPPPPPLTIICRVL